MDLRGLDSFGALMLLLHRGKFSWVTDYHIQIQRQSDKLTKMIKPFTFISFREVVHNRANLWNYLAEIKDVYWYVRSARIPRNYVAWRHHASYTRCPSRSSLQLKSQLTLSWTCYSINIRCTLTWNVTNLLFNWRLRKCGCLLGCFWRPGHSAKGGQVGSQGKNKTCAAADKLTTLFELSSGPRC